MAYHSEWKKSATNENFFYWLDEGEGRFIDVQGCPRWRLDRERVRYLSREERLNYLVKIDKEGRLVWAKNGARIDTTEKYKDSIHGIVPATDPTPPYIEPEAEAATGSQNRESSVDEATDSSTSERSGSHESARAGKYANPELDGTQGMKKVKHVSASTIFNKLLRSTMKKNTWIFVADTSFRLYVGIKQSGTFQHSSFLHGSRITAAGLIKIKDGLLDKLSPLSGHYRPSTSQFRAFLHSLKDTGADMSHVSISRSYFILSGLEEYLKTRRRVKKLLNVLIHGRDRLLTHDELKQHEQEELDETERAAREENKASIKLLQKPHIQPATPYFGVSGTAKDAIEERPEEEDVVAPPGTGLENTITRRDT